MKKIFLLLLVSLIVLGNVSAANVNESVSIVYFYQDVCSHCAAQSKFLEGLMEEYPGKIDIEKHNVRDAESMDLLYKMIDEHGLVLDRMGTPMTFVEGEFFMGFNSLIGDKMEGIVAEKLGVDISQNDSEGMTYLPFIGEVDLDGFSLPIITFIISSLDGLNVCSIGALILILAIVIKFDSRKKILLAGSVFILTTAVVYGLFVFVWYGLIKSLMSYMGVMQLIIGAAGIFGGIYFFRQFLFFYRYGPSCQVQSNKYVLRMQEKVDLILGNPRKGYFLIIGVLILFATLIILVELPCSFALPVVFSGILADAGVSSLSSFVYILIYLFFYMLIEIMIFLGAVYTKQIWYGPEKAVTWVTFLASLVMFLFGVYYIYPLI